MSFARSVLIFIAWLFLIALSVYFFITNVAVYVTGFRSNVFGDTLFHNQVWVVMHLIGGTLALFLGPLQFWNAFRNKYLHLHRLLGKIYMIGVALVGLSALRLSLISYCEPCRVSLFILAVLALLSTFFAWKSIKTKNIKVHRQFMIRSFICVFSFVAVRIDDVFPLDFFFGAVEDKTFRRVMNEYFFSFVPLITGEIFMTWLPAVKQKGKTI
ncbi:MAG: hypothetical protein C0490_02530 [Marivirga sp.]|nr:hypothetical protein [Marivirga sp.]